MGDDSNFSHCYIPILNGIPSHALLSLKKLSWPYRAFVQWKKPAYFLGTILTAWLINMYRKYLRLCIISSLSKNLKLFMKSCPCQSYIHGMCCNQSLWLNHISVLTYSILKLDVPPSKARRWPFKSNNFIETIFWGACTTRSWACINHTWSQF